MTHLFSNNPLVWPWWLQLLIGLVATAELSVFAWLTSELRSSRWRRVMRIAELDGRYLYRRGQRPKRAAEDRYWADEDLRRREAQHALAITADRTRAEREMPARLLRNVTG